MKAGKRKIAVALRERWCRIIVAHIPCITDFMCVHIIFKAWWCNLMHSNWPTKVFMICCREGWSRLPCTQLPIYDTPNSLLTKSIVDRDTLVHKKLGLARTLKIISLIFCSHLATLTHEKRENLGPVIRKNIIAKILFTCCTVKFSYRENFRVYGTSDDRAPLCN